MEFNLKKILRALLFSTSEYLSIKDIQAVITRYHRDAEHAAEEVSDATAESDGAKPGEQEQLKAIIEQVPSLLTASQIRDAMDAIAVELVEQGEVYRLIQGPSGFRFATAPDYAEWVRLMRDDPKPLRLSQAALETLAIVAYRQPVTRAEMEAVRGVAVDSALNRLTDLELIHVTGRADLPGRPLQYGTTEKFLEFCGIRSLEELPASDVLSASQINEWIRRASLPEKAPGDAEMGLPDDDVPHEEPTLVTEPTADSHGS